MTTAYLTELHSIMPIGNIPSVLQYGILSYDRASQLPHTDVSMAVVQERRDHVQVPNGLKLHQYANVYFHARNPMLFVRKDEAADLCVLRVSADILNLPHVVITDQNAASDYVGFYAPSQLDRLNFDWIYADDWRHADDKIAYWRHKSIKCAEVLIPNSVECGYIVGAYVVDSQAQVRLAQLGFTLPVEVNPHLFFR